MHLNECVGSQVDDKYQYSIENKHNTVHGWMSSDSDAPVGFWIITPSNEFRNAGPIKQDLTSHVGPTSLCVSPSPLLPYLTQIHPNMTQYMYTLTKK